MTVKRDNGTDADVIQAAGYSTYQSALLAGGAIPEDADVGTFLNLLTRTAMLNRVGAAFAKAGSRMMRGEDIEQSQLYEYFQMMQGDYTEFVHMDEVEAETNIWIPTHWDAWDEYFAGVPRYGLILVAAPPGTGKTSLVVKLIDKMTRNNQQVDFVSLEMTKEVVKKRWLEMRPNLSRNQAHRLRISDLDYSLDGACAAIAREVSRNPETYAIFIDYADLMVILESTESASQIYIKLAKLSKKIDKPIFLISQLSRNYVGGVPHVNDVRYSGLAEAAASMIVLIYNPDQLFVDMGKEDKKNKLPTVEGMAYIILGKSRFGYKMKGVGAIRLPWDGAEGWSDTADGWERL